MKILISMIAGIVIALAALAGFALSGWYDVSARAPHSEPVRWLLATTTHRSVQRRAQAVEVPDLVDARRSLAGAGDFDAMCAGCHGAPGQEPGAVGKGLVPAPPDLSDAADHLTAAELFWITRNGIRMTGMPAWGETHSDAELWPIVAFVLELPWLDGDAYRAAAADTGHQDHGHGHDH